MGLCFYQVFLLVYLLFTANIHCKLVNKTKYNSKYNIGVEFYSRRHSRLLSLSSAEKSDIGYVLTIFFTFHISLSLSLSLRSRQSLVDCALTRLSPQQRGGIKSYFKAT